MPSCQIIYSNTSNGIYYSGEVITGTIIVDNEETRKIHHISLTFEGRAKSKWYKQKGFNYRLKYIGQEQYVYEKKYLVKSDQDDCDVDFSKKIHEYPFSFRTGELFPTSIEANENKLHSGGTQKLHGFIRYVITVKITRSWKSDIKFEFPLTIIKEFDLNYLGPRFRTPTTFEDKFSSKLFHMLVETQFSAFVCGEKGIFLVKYENFSSKDVLHTKVQLIRIVYYNAEQPKVKTKMAYEKIEEQIFGGVSAHTRKNIETYLDFPSVAPTSDGSCRVLKVAYEIHVVAVFEENSIHTVKFPIVIGTVPLNHKASSEISTPNYNYIEASSGVPFDCVNESSDSERSEVIEFDYTPRYPVFQLENNKNLESTKTKFF